MGVDQPMRSGHKTGFTFYQLAFPSIFAIYAIAASQVYNIMPGGEEMEFFSSFPCSIYTRGSYQLSPLSSLVTTPRPVQSLLDGHCLDVGELLIQSMFRIEIEYTLIEEDTKQRPKLLKHFLGHVFVRFDLCWELCDFPSL
jgi:hypothetical protein